MSESKTRRSRGAVAALALAMTVLAGCAGKGAPEAGYRDPNPLPADTMTVPMPELGVHGGRFVIAQTASPKSFNALLAVDSPSRDINGLLFSGLTEFDNETEESYPLLARAWDVSPDGTLYTFHLRRGLRFSDGHPLTAADVLFMFELVYDGVLHPSLQELLKVDGQPLQVSAPDSVTVLVRSPRPYALMVPAVGALRILPRHIVEPLFRAGRFSLAYGTDTPPESLVTSGAWRLRRFAPDDRTVLARNPYWFQVDARGGRLPYLDELVVLTVPDQNTASAKFQAGELDALDNVRAEDYKAYADGQRAGGYTLHDLGPSLTSSCIWFNLARVRPDQARGGTAARAVGRPYVDAVKYTWFADVRFRRAVSMAIDREAIIRGVYHGDGVESWSQVTPGNRHWSDPGTRGAAYDPAGARRLLAELGMRDRDGDGVLEDSTGHDVEFALRTNSDNNTRVAMCDFVRDDLAKVGVRVIPEGVTMSTLVANIQDDHRYEAVLLGFGSGVPPDPGMAQSIFRSSGRMHYWDPSQPRPETAEEARIDSLMSRNVSTLDFEVRRQTWHEIERLVNDACFVVWLPTQRIKLPVRDRFGNVHPTVIPHRVLWNIAEVFARPVDRKR
jgi:peptide/nickel transport system substrate-binding protein